VTSVRLFLRSRVAACFAQPVLWLLWITLPRTRITDLIKLLVFTGGLAVFGVLAATAFFRARVKSCPATGHL